MPLSTWFWAAYLISSQAPRMSSVQFQGQLGLKRYETAFGVLHKLRAGMVRSDREKIGGKPQEYVEVDETLVGGRARGEGRGVHHKVLVLCAVEVRLGKPGIKLDNRKGGRDAGRIRLALYQRRQPLTCSAQSRVAMAVMRPGSAASLFQASQQASTMS
jgi:hypothetical protein